MTNNRKAPIEISKEEFKKIGHRLIDSISDFINTIKDNHVSAGESPFEVQKILKNLALPENGKPVDELLSSTTELLFKHSLFNGHPKFMGYITSSAAPIGALADLLAAAINPNVGAQIVSPIATEIEKQTIKWLAEFIGISPNYGGVLVSGGNMANFTAFLAARNAKAPKTIKEEGLTSSNNLIVYCSKATHIWIEKATILFGHGSNSIRWIPTLLSNKMNTEILEQTINEDLAKGDQPFLVVGTAGDVSTGAVDDLKAIASVSKKYNLWFHIDGAYGIPAAVIPKLKTMFDGVKEADSIALDPHKWLYSPLEAGCTLVKNPMHLIDTFSSHPDYYNFDRNEKDTFQNYYEYGLQNSRGFRALKVWLALQQVGKNGYIKMIGDDIELAELLFKLAKEHPELETLTQNLSITTFRYVPLNYKLNSNTNDEYLNKLNETLLNELQQGGELFISNAVITGKYCLRACIVNFRTSKKDIIESIEIVVKIGKRVHQELQDKESL